jgi:hypothetical protein
VAKVAEGAPWDLIFEHKGGRTEVVAEGFCRIQDGCGGKSAALLAPVTLPPPIVWPIKPKSWVVAPNDGAGQLYAGAWMDSAFNPVAAPFTAAPVVGSLVLTAFNDSSTQETYFHVTVFDGSGWVPCPQFMHASMDRGAGGAVTVYGFISGPNAAVSAGAAAMGAMQFVVWSQSDGIHVNFMDGDGRVEQNVLAFPAGVTEADMPPTKYF